jgi:hypothetical protein
MMGYYDDRLCTCFEQSYGNMINIYGNIYELTHASCGLTVNGEQDA